MKILGAGMSGLLAAQYFRSHQPTILEKQPELPDNHNALLRFRSDAVSVLTGIRFRKVKVHKMISYRGDHFITPSLFLNNLYSKKVAGAFRGRSMLNLAPADRFISPADFIPRLGHGLDIQYKADAHPAIVKQIVDSTEPMISTLPVEVLANALSYDLDVHLHSMAIWSVSFDLTCVACNVYQTVYYPEPADSVYRISITGNKVIAEYMSNPGDYFHVELSEKLASDFGITDFGVANQVIKRQRLGKLVECDGDEVKKFLGHATREYNIYSLGRWGTHRQLLMDDVVADLKVIDKLIHSYGYNK